MKDYTGNRLCEGLYREPLQSACNERCGRTLCLQTCEYDGHRPTGCTGQCHMEDDNWKKDKPIRTWKQPVYMMTRMMSGPRVILCS